jgi:hypothetical protein
MKGEAMSEESKIPRNTGAEEDTASEGGEGARNADATPTIADDAEKEKTAQRAPGDDANRAGGMPSEKVHEPHP